MSTVTLGNHSAVNENLLDMLDNKYELCNNLIIFANKELNGINPKDMLSNKKLKEFAENVNSLIRTRVIRFESKIQKLEGENKIKYTLKSNNLKISFEALKNRYVESFKISESIQKEKEKVEKFLNILNQPLADVYDYYQEFDYVEKLKSCLNEEHLCIRYLDKMVLAVSRLKSIRNRDKMLRCISRIPSNENNFKELINLIKENCDHLVSIYSKLDSDDENDYELMHTQPDDFFEIMVYSSLKEDNPAQALRIIPEIQDNKIEINCMAAIIKELNKKRPKREKGFVKHYISNLKINSDDKENILNALERYREHRKWLNKAYPY